LGISFVDIPLDFLDMRWNITSWLATENETNLEETPTAMHGMGHKTTIAVCELQKTADSPKRLVVIINPTVLPVSCSVRHNKIMEDMKERFEVLL
jgi:hypothetical protein